MNDPCPQCNEADLEPRGPKSVCPGCGYIAPCCQPDLPASMLRPVTFDDSPDDDLKVVKFVPAPEEEDSW